MDPGTRFDHGLTCQHGASGHGAAPRAGSGGDRDNPEPQREAGAMQTLPEEGKGKVRTRLG